MRETELLEVENLEITFCIESLSLRHTNISRYIPVALFTFYISCFWLLLNKNKFTVRKVKLIYHDYWCTYSIPSYLLTNYCYQLLNNYTLILLWPWHLVTSCITYSILVA